MIALKNPAHRAWLVLLVATAITWYLGEVGAAGTLAIVRVQAPEITTLATRNSDALDFRSLAVWTLQAILRNAATF